MSPSQQLCLRTACVSCDAGVVENILGRVLDAFQMRMNSLLRDSLAKGFAESATLAQQMAAEPAALLLETPLAFFVGKATDTPDAFLKAVQQAGFGTGDEAAQVAVLSQLAQVYLLTLNMTKLTELYLGPD